jgi:predicted MFS family arabinose efflux permease
MDRSIISIPAPSIQADLHLTDTQLGLLGGTAFALLYGLGGLPIARLAASLRRFALGSLSTSNSRFRPRYVA